MLTVAIGVVLAAAGLLVAGRVRPWLAAGRHRYADETDLPTRHHTWILPTTSVVAGLVGLAWAERPVHAVIFSAFAVFLVLICAIDADVHRLPNRWTYPAAALAPVATGVLALVDGDLSSWGRSLLAGLALGGVYLVLVILGAVIGGGGMGLGDAKLAPSIGTILGFLSWGHVLVGTFAAILIGGIVAVVLLLTRRAGRGSHFAFGPCMAAGAVLILAAPVAGALS